MRESTQRKPRPTSEAAALVAVAAMATTTAAPGLTVAATDPIRSFLSSTAASGDLDADLRELASALSSEPDVPYRSLRAIWCAASPDARPPLRSLLRGADFVLPSPKPREKVLSRPLGPS